ncbi:hypothetical protein C2857_006898 [Epichloe festucae Fl1]|uniref:EKC/KEOPS complex subunit BUD32 n=1 Tax=Epichloe festucae (strain Fl1) TaxID=877507 RepID=A0A7S9KLX1_EPIFF|nr:hypothetical protein C2857_006898 [Epichloe festucae Fl1]
MPSSSHISSHEIPYGEIYYTAKGDFVGSGATSIVNRLTDDSIVKYPKPNSYCPHEEDRCRQEIITEAAAYQRIGNSDRTPAFISWDAESHSLVLEYLKNGDLQSYMRRHGTLVTAKRRFQWTLQAAEALVVVHEADIIHCDVTPRNFMLDETLELHIADFAGSSISGSLPTITTSPRFQRPGWSWKRKPEIRDDIFALGSVLFFILTGYEPYDDLAEDEVEKRFQKGDFPDVTFLSCGSIITGCWTGSFETASRVAHALAAINSQNVLQRQDSI